MIREEMGSGPLTTQLMSISYMLTSILVQLHY